jgi:hypothetical protein
VKVLDFNRELGWIDKQFIQTDIRMVNVRISLFFFRMHLYGSMLFGMRMFEHVFFANLFHVKLCVCVWVRAQCIMNLVFINLVTTCRCHVFSSALVMSFCTLDFCLSCLRCLITCAANRSLPDKCHAD